MAIIHVTEATAGLPNSGRLSGTNGDLVGIMDVALPLNGWAIEYTSGNARIYRPGSGNRLRLHMYDDSAVSGDARLCLVRGCENASDATTLVDPFPLVSQVANSSSNWVKSSAANTTARTFDIFVGEDFVIYMTNHTGTTNVNEVHIFGDCAPAYIADTYFTLCTVRDSSGVGVTWSSWVQTAAGGESTMYLARSYDGTVKSVRCGILGLANQTTFGALPFAPNIFLGPSTGVDTKKVSLACSGSQSTTASSSLSLPERGWIKNFLQPMHNGRQASTPNTRDIYTNTSVDPSFLGMFFTSGNSANNPTAIVQYDGPWTPPNG